MRTSICCRRSVRASERGFTLIEAVVAIALTAVVTLALAAAVTHAMHAASISTTSLGLRDDALDVLADLRAATTYDPVLLARMVGRSSTATLALHSGAIDETVTVRVDPAPGRPSISLAAVATATVVRGDARVTEHATLYAQAPPPGSTVAQ